MRTKKKNLVSPVEQTQWAQFWSYGLVLFIQILSKYTPKCLGQPNHSMPIWVKI